MLVNPFEQNEVTFEETAHIYTVNSTGQRLISVSTLIHKYTQEFDPTGDITRNYAAKHGMTVDEVKAKWDKKRDDACARGTLFHEQAETFLNTGEIPEGPDEDILTDFAAKVKFRGKVFSEVLLYSIEHGIAGTADIIEYFPDNNSVAVKDFKTNEQLKKWGFKGQRMKRPFEHLQDCNMSVYELQLSTYLYLLELKGFQVRKNDLRIYWINPITRIIEVIPIPYRRKEVIDLLF